ncbi:MAG: metallophosphoesterase [Cyclobacteriaceae bacterium]
MIRILILLALMMSHVANAQKAVFPKEWWFWPDYTLERNAKNQIGPRLEAPTSPTTALKARTYPLVFFGQEPTERLEDFMPAAQVPTAAFTIEMWILYHVNQDVGTFTAFRPQHEPSDPTWLVGMCGREFIFSLKEEDMDFSTVLNHELTERGWKNYWVHLVASYDGTAAKLYLNGVEKASTTIGTLSKTEASDMQLETAAYLSNEPYMQLGDLLKCLRIHDRSLTPHEINLSYADFQSIVEEGALYPHLFHYTAGPYLQMATPTTMGIVWETSEASSTVIEYGTSLPLSEKITLETMALNHETNAYEGSHINKHVLIGLDPGQPYFYNIKSTSANGEVIESGISTFKAPDQNPASFTFSVIGDTEARPHVNNRVAKLLWDERPDFLLNLGDLTDGGKEAHKYQWNYEYFHGINQFTSRIPIYPVAGNGEGDLYWFNKYHILPIEDKAYYKFSHGNSEFFMLDSNRKDQFTVGGEQYVWLEEQLSQSTAQWKFVAHHHAPYSSDEDDYGDSWKAASTMGDPKIKPIVPLYEKYGVDAVFFGHLHTYQRTHPIKDDKVSKSNGVMYIQAGGAGGNLEDFAPTRSWFSAKTFRGHHYLTVEVSGSELELRMYDSEGRMKDIFNISKADD